VGAETGGSASAQRFQSRPQQSQSRAQQFQSGPQQFQNLAQQNPNVFINEFKILSRNAVNALPAHA
jgi:hypothetical protein